MHKPLPRDVLSDTDLIGFVRTRPSDQIARRASSAKVTEPDDPAKLAADALMRAKSGK